MLCMIVPTMILYSKGKNVKNCDNACEFYAAKLRLRTGNPVILSDKIDDKRKVDKSSNYILYTQKET